MSVSCRRGICVPMRTGGVFEMPLHLWALLLGFGLDLLLGDPEHLPHPVCFIGRLIHKTETFLRAKPVLTAKQECLRGGLLCLWVVLVSTAIPLLLLYFAYRLHTAVGFVLESLLSWQILATKCLGKEAEGVYRVLQTGDLPQSRRQLARIVGRDTANLDETGICKACIETVAENTSDGVIAPLLFCTLGGASLGLCYKSINTMDSMLGYKNERYLHFGRCAAKLDDFANFIPARVTAGLMLLATGLLGYDLKHAWHIFWRDRNAHASPNAGQSEAVCAGALRIQLAGNASYGGMLFEKAHLGDALQAVSANDILRAKRLLYATAILGMAGVLLVAWGLEAW